MTLHEKINTESLLADLREAIIKRKLVCLNFQDEEQAHAYAAQTRKLCKNYEVLRESFQDSLLDTLMVFNDLSAGFAILGV